MIKDYHLFVMVGVMLLFDCLLLLPWSTMYPLTTSIHIFMAQVNTMSIPSIFEF